MKKKIWGVLIVVLIGMQFIPYHIKNEPVDEKQDIFANVSASPEVIDIMHAACYDCHSQKAVTPWYGYVAPIKFWLNKHVRGARMHVNFSQWSTYDQPARNHMLEECVEQMEMEEMPLASYTLLHPEAKLSSDQRKQLIAFFEGVQEE